MNSWTYCCVVYPTLAHSYRTPPYHPLHPTVSISWHTLQVMIIWESYYKILVRLIHLTNQIYHFAHRFSSQRPVSHRFLNHALQHRKIVQQVNAAPIGAVCAFSNFFHKPKTLQDQIIVKSGLTQRQYKLHALGLWAAAVTAGIFVISAVM